MRKALNISFFVILLGSLSIWLTAQTKRPKTVKKTTPAIAATPEPKPASVPETLVKRNERPSVATPETKTNSRIGANNATLAVNTAPPYSYEFDRPGFTYPRIIIEHDDTGKGKISFKKDGFEDLLTDPLQLSVVTVENLKTSFAALNFLDSNENYQYPKDFSNMGNVTITLRRDGRMRSAKYNWTENRDARALMDEYRRISNEYTWKFEMTIGRENQPLLTPSMMDGMDSLLRQNEISDPPHLIPFLTELSNDERLPLMARNHAGKLIKQIEKPKK